ncbi:hypothetical protein [Mangrovihabitans endophyticus]|uniref:SipW-cognate class signal peptide n=1 Tax=Mangrovihabitans endophyticus TaxID=1751298 RepID=A0A8J3C1G4_9ACTN|nr:hypothetical protein [Mangrovihabitans endophyticus]GGL04676.1 hypothetical protein GCM10012284_44090 [Mangrovihabitans endophyticus]
MRKLTKRSTAIAASVAVAVGAAGVAWAAWSLTGSGDAQAKADTVKSLKVTSAGLPPGGLTPGNATAVLLTVENKNPFPVRITSITLSSLKSGKSGCEAGDNVDIVNSAPLPTDAAKVTVPAGTEENPATAKITWDGPLKMRPDPANACQGAPFSFNVNLNAISAAS